MNINLFEEAKKVLVGGVNSPVRSFKMVGETPIFVKNAKGKYIIDEDNRKFVDYCLSWGGIILGHNHSVVAREIRKAIKNGTNFGFSHKYEAILANLIQKAFPSMEKIRFVNSGTEAVMSAIRLARGFTKKDKVLKFDGCYHGHSDGLLVKSGSGVSEIISSTSEGIPNEIIKNTISIPFNDKEILKFAFKKYGGELACIVIEPVPANMGLIIPDEEFLYLLRKLCDQYGVILIFDEVITGFRVALGGAQEIFKIKPDVTILGKIIGGGLPIGAFGGRNEIMKLLAPEGNVYQAGTLSGNPISTRAGISVLEFLFKNKHIYKKMSNMLEYFSLEWRKKEIPFRLNVFSTIFSIFYTSLEVREYNAACQQDIFLFKQFYKKMLKKNILFPPSCFETCFLSIEHTQKDLNDLINLFSEKISNYTVFPQN